MSVATKIETMITMIYRSVETLEKNCKIAILVDQVHKDFADSPHPLFLFCFEQCQKTAILVAKGNPNTEPDFSANGVPQRPKKSELSRWQLSMRKNFPTKCVNRFLRQKNA